MTAIAVCAMMGIISFMFLADWFTLSGQSALFAGGVAVYLFVFHRIKPAIPLRAETAPQPESQPTDHPSEYSKVGASEVRQAQAKHRAQAPVNVQKLTYYQREAITINQLLADVYKLNCGIDFRSPKAIVPAYGYINYVLTQTGPLRFSDLEKIADDLAREINSLHRKFEFGELSVIPVNSQPITLQVTRAKPQRLMWSERNLTRMKPLQIVMGHYYHGAHRHDLVIDLAGKETVWLNASYFGMPTSGKSTILHIKLINLLEATPPEMLDVYAIDLKADAYRCYSRLPHVRRVACDIDGAIDILEDFERWCTADGKPTDGKIRLLLLDECQELFLHLEHGEKCARLISRIMGLGREAGIRVWQATQNPDKESYPSSLKAKTHYMAAAMTTNDHYLHNVLGITGASKLRQKGEFIFVGPFGTERLTTFWMTDEDRAAAIERIARRWGTQNGADTARYKADTPRYQPDTKPDMGRYEVDISPDMGVSPLVEIEKTFPVRESRPLTDHEAKLVRYMASLERYQYNGEVSMSKLVPAVYGSRNPQRTAWAREALEGADNE